MNAISELTNNRNCNILDDMGKGKGMTDLGNQLRKACEDSGVSMYELARRAGLSYSQLYHFMRDSRTLTLNSAGRLAAALQLELRPTKGK